MNIADSLYKEYEAVRSVEEMDNVEVMMFVDERVISTREMTMPEYRIKAINLIMKGKK